MYQCIRASVTMKRCSPPTIFSGEGRESVMQKPICVPCITPHGWRSSGVRPKKWQCGLPHPALHVKCLDLVLRKRYPDCPVPGAGCLPAIYAAWYPPVHPVGTSLKVSFRMESQQRIPVFVMFVTLKGLPVYPGIPLQ